MLPLVSVTGNDSPDNLNSSYYISLDILNKKSLKKSDILNLLLLYCFLTIRKSGGGQNGPLIEIHYTYHKMMKY